MKRKRMIKLLMSQGVPRNEAVVYADACGPKMPHNLMGFMVAVHPEIRECVRPFLTQILQGTLFSMHLEAPDE
ncbi:MAG: hypothetical protein MR648_05125 [Clostridiales bacterium]|nr:hypothetical protein [Clostridiales bacterium]MDY4181008.1 hypothetical protein [Pseudoflavonifractor sp.]